MKLPAVADFDRQFKSEIWREAARVICRRHNLTFEAPTRAEQGESVVFLIDDKFVLKIYVPSKKAMTREKTSLETARSRIKTPEVVGCGEIEDYQYLLTTRIEGEPMNREMWLKLDRSEQIPILSELADGLQDLHGCDAAKIDFDWAQFVRRQAENCFERQRSCQVNDKVLAQIPSFLEANLKLLPRNFAPAFLHGDVHFGNLRFSRKGGKWRISGLFDFADSLKGFHEYDFLAVGVLMIQGQGDLQREFFRSFGYRDSDIDETLRKRLMLLTMFYEWSDLRRYAIRLRPEAVDYSLDELERAIWNFV